MASYKRRSRSRGRIEQLPSGSLRAVVYAGTDPLTGRRHFVREVIPAGPDAAKEAEKAVRRLAGQVDECRHPTTNAMLDQLLDRYLEKLDVAETTRRMYARYAEKHIRPFVGRLRAAGPGERGVSIVQALAVIARSHLEPHRRGGRGLHQTGQKAVAHRFGACDQAARARSSGATCASSPPTVALPDTGRFRRLSR